MLNLTIEQWRGLAWWQRKVYTNGLEWEFEQGGLFPHPEYLRAKAQGGGGESGGTFVPLDTMEARAAEGISTGTVYQ